LEWHTLNGSRYARMLLQSCRLTQILAEVKHKLFLVCSTGIPEESSFFSV
jgi:hypothetical protein